MLTFRQIEVFKAVMELGSLSASARQLKISQPTISRLVLRIEDQLGISLFTRSKGRLVPTQEAQRFLEEIDRAFQAMRTAIDRGTQVAKPVQSIFRCGASPSVGRSLVPQAAAKLLAGNPHQTLQLDILSVNQVIPYLLDDFADAAVTLFPILHQQIISKCVGHGRPMLVVPRSMAPVSFDGLNTGILNSLDWIVFQPRSVHGDMLASLLGEIGVRPLRTHVVRFAETAIALVEQGLGISIVDEFSVRAADRTAVHCTPVQTSHQYDVYLHRRVTNGRLDIFDQFGANLEKGMNAPPAF